jgi:hypothetical protein
LIQKKAGIKFLLSKAYLLIIAAWLITVSFIIDNYWSKNSTVENVHKQVEKYIGDFELNFNNTADEIKKQGDTWVKKPITSTQTGLSNQVAVINIYCIGVLKLYFLQIQLLMLQII